MIHMPYENKKPRKPLHESYTKHRTKKRNIKDKLLARQDETILYYDDNGKEQMETYKGGRGRNNMKGKKEKKKGEVRFVGTERKKNKKKRSGRRKSQCAQNLSKQDGGE